MNERLLLRVEEVAEALGIGRSKAYELITAGELPVVRLGRCVRVPAAAVRGWMEAQCPSEPSVVAYEPHSGASVGRHQPKAPRG